MTPFHLAFTVRDLERTRAFYGEGLGCAMGRSAPTWQDFDLFGHQLSAHTGPPAATEGGAVDGQTVPVPHFGVVLPLADWERLAERLKSRDIPFLIAPRLRFEGEPGEQGTFFVQDPSGNVLEFKGFADMGQVFED